MRWIRAGARELDSQVGPSNMFQIHGRQDFYRNQNFIARFCRIEQEDGLERITHGYAAPVEINNLRCRTIGIVPKVEPDSRSSEIVSMQTFRDFDPAAIPHCFVGPLTIWTDGFP